MICKCLRRARRITCHQVLLPDSWHWRWLSASLITHTEVAEKWTSMVLRVNKHNFCLVVIEFELLYAHPITYISDTVLYAQPCNIDITIFKRYVELSIISLEMIVESMTSYYLSRWCGVQ